MRGRNNNNNNNNSGNRKSPNPLQRSYESNGPDVKVRGTAQHVAEKYLQLARDAQSSGDTVAAENYFQHAEHYYRILLAAQEQMSQQFGHSFPPNRAFNEDAEDGDEDGEEGQSFQPGAGPQPEIRSGHGMNGNGYNPNGGQRQEGEAGDGQSGGGQRFDRQGRNRQDRFGSDRNGERRFDRNDRGDRRFERSEGGNAPGGYAPRPDAPRSDIPVAAEQVEAAAEASQGERRPERPERAPRAERRSRREREVEVEEGAGALPSFLTTPVRVPIAVAEQPAAADAVEGSQEVEAASAEAAPKRVRRRRSPREVMDALGAETDGSTE